MAVDCWAHFFAYVEQQEINLSLAQQQQFQDYVELLLKWNKHYNLTAITEQDEIIIKHLMDSLSVVPFIQQLLRKRKISKPSFADVGTGAGLPGVPLAIVFPEFEFTLIDAREKKIKFLRQIKAQLQLENITPLSQRVETISPLKPFDFILTRAFSSLAEMLRLTRKLCNTDGWFIAMKGQYPKQEHDEVCEQYDVMYENIQVPLLDANRCVLMIQKNKN